jgi:hypothetical protein
MITGSITYSIVLFMHTFHWVCTLNWWNEKFVFYFLIFVTKNKEWKRSFISRSLNYSNNKKDIYVFIHSILMYLKGASGLNYFCIQSSFSLWNNSCCIFVWESCYCLWTPVLIWFPANSPLSLKYGLSYFVVSSLLKGSFSCGSNS